MKKAFSLLLAILLVMSIPAMAEYDPVIVRVGMLGYTRSQIREAIELAKESYIQQGGTVTADIEKRIQKDVLDRFVQQGVVENKIRELGLDTPTKEELAELEKQTEEQWQKAMEQVKAEMIDRYHVTPEKADAYAEMYLDLAGVTKEELRMELGLLWKQNKLTEYVAKNVPRLTDEEAENWYYENLVLPGKTAYADDIEAFETDVILNGADCYYVPGEYRYIQNIVFYAPEEAQEDCQLKQLSLQDAQEELTRAQNALYGCQVLEEDTTEAEAAVAAAEENIAALTKEIENMKKAMAQEFAPQIDDITKRLRIGEDFMALREKYDQNTEAPENGYLVCADSVIWEAAFKDAAMALEKPGDTCGPIYTTAGPQFLLYAGDAPRGALPLDDESREAVKKLAQASADNQLLGGFINQWKKEYEIVTNEELLALN